MVWASSSAHGSITGFNGVTTVMVSKSMDGWQGICATHWGRPCTWG